MGRGLPVPLSADEGSNFGRRKSTSMNPRVCGHSVNASTPAPSPKGFLGVTRLLPPSLSSTELRSFTKVRYNPRRPPAHFPDDHLENLPPEKPGFARELPRIRLASLERQKVRTLFARKPRANIKGPLLPSVGVRGVLPNRLLRSGRTPPIKKKNKSVPVPPSQVSGKEEEDRILTPVIPVSLGVGISQSMRCTSEDSGSLGSRDRKRPLEGDRKQFP